MGNFSSTVGHTAQPIRLNKQPGSILSSPTQAFVPLNNGDGIPGIDENEEPGYKFDEESGCDTTDSNATQNLLDVCSTVNDMIWFENKLRSMSKIENCSEYNQNLRKPESKGKYLKDIEELLDILLRCCVDFAFRRHHGLWKFSKKNCEDKMEAIENYKERLKEVISVVNECIQIEDDKNLRTIPDIDLSKTFGMFDKEIENDIGDIKQCYKIAVFCEVLDTYTNFFREKGRESKVSDPCNPWPDKPSISILLVEDEPCDQTSRINLRVALANDLISILARYDGVRESIEKVPQSVSNIDDDYKDYLRASFVEVNPIWKVERDIRGNNISFLLFEDERERMDAILNMGENPLNHWGSIAARLPDVSDQEESATLRAIKITDLLRISLKSADYYESDCSDSPSTYPMNVNKIKDAIMTFLPLILYLTDICTDLDVAVNHYFERKYLFAFLTMSFICLPIFADILSKILLKTLGWGKKYGMYSWKDAFQMNVIKVIPRMWNKMICLIKSWNDYGDIAAAYSDLHYYRCLKSQMIFKQEFWNRKNSCIQNLLKIFISWNEIIIGQVALTESLNESASQLFLQLAIVFGTNYDVLVDQDTKPPWRSITTSLLSLSYSMHSAHNNIHRGGIEVIWKKDFNLALLAIETIGNSFIYGARFASMSALAAYFPIQFFTVMLIYIFILYYFLTLVSGRSNHYRKLHGFQSTLFWPINRIFTIPYTVGIWRLDSFDHFVFYLETVIMALFIIKNELFMWKIAVTIIASAIVSFLIFVIYKILHPICDRCKNFDNIDSKHDESTPMYLKETDLI